MEEGRDLGTTEDGWDLGTMEEGWDLGTTEEGRSGGPQRRTGAGDHGGGQSGGTTAYSRGSQQPPSEGRMDLPSHRRLGLVQTAHYNPIPGPSVFLSNYLSHSLIKEDCSKKAGRREGMSHLAVASFGKSGKTVASRRA